MHIGRQKAGRCQCSTGFLPISTSDGRRPRCAFWSQAEQALSVQPCVAGCPAYTGEAWRKIKFRSEEKLKKLASNGAIFIFFDNRVARYARQVKPSARGGLEITDLQTLRYHSTDALTPSAWGGCWKRAAMAGISPKRNCARRRKRPPPFC